MSASATQGGHNKISRSLLKSSLVILVHSILYKTTCFNGYEIIYLKKAIVVNMTSSTVLPLVSHFNYTSPEALVPC